MGVSKAGPLLRRLYSACSGSGTQQGGVGKLSETREARVRALAYIEDLALVEEGTLCDAVSAYRTGALDIEDLFALALLHLKGA